MNELHDFSDSLATAIQSEGGTAVRAPDGSIDAFRLPNGAAVAWRPPASCDPNETSSELHQGARMHRLASNATARAATAATNADLSEAKKQADMATIYDQASAEIAALAATAETALTQFEAYERAQLSPPRPTDPAEAARAGEVRSRFLALDKTAQLAMGKAMHDGEHAAVLAAMADSPWPLPSGIAEVIGSAWTRHLERTQPEVVKAITQRRDRLTWLLDLAQQCAGAVRAAPSPASAMQAARAAEQARRAA